MGDHNEQEAADLAAMNDGDDLFELRYLGGSLSDSDMYDIPDDVFFRLRIDLSVTDIDEDACMECGLLIEVVFHEKVTVIGRHAFQRCFNLRRVELPAGLLRVEECAFEGCASLRGEIVIPASVQFIDICVFNECTSLESVIFVPTTNNVVPVQLGGRMFESCSNLQFVALPPNLRSIPWGFFSYCTSLTHLHIPESVEEIGEEALYGSGIESIDCPEKVHRIGTKAFGRCSSLTEVMMHSSSNHVTLATEIFVNCPALSVIKLYPWLWPTVFASMKEQPDFIIKFFRHYHTKIFDFETPDVRRPLQRLRRR